METTDDRKLRAGRISLSITDWQLRAACIGLPSEMFFAERGTRGPDSHDNESGLGGLAYCRRCPVAQECLDFAVANRIEIGVFGGLTSKQRIRRRKQGHPVLLPPRSAVKVEQPV